MCGARRMNVCGRVLALGVVALLGFPASGWGQPVPLRWSDTYSGDGIAEGAAVAADTSGVYVTGNTYAEGGNRDSILLKYKLDYLDGVTRECEDTWGVAGVTEWGFGVAVFGDEVHVAGQTRRYGSADSMTLKYDLDCVLDTSNSEDGWWTLYSGEGPYVGYEWAWDAVLDGSGNLYVAGQTEPGWMNSVAYVEQYNSSGVNQWHDDYGTVATYSNASASSLALANNHLYVAGWYSADGSDNQVLVLKYETDGTRVWTYLWNAGGTCQSASDIAVFGDSIYIVGQLGASCDASAADVLLLKLQDDGDSASFVDSTTFPGPGGDLDNGKGVVVAGGRIYVAGYADVGGHRDALLLAYEMDLDLLWDYSWRGSGDDAAYGIAYHDGVLYVVGTMQTEELVDQAFINAYTAPDPIPAVSEWGLVAMALLVLAAGTVVILRRRVAVTAR